MKTLVATGGGDDEEEPITVNSEESQEIIDWAVDAASTMVALDRLNPEADEPLQSALDRLATLDSQLRRLIEAVPEAMQYPAAVVAHQIANEAAIEAEIEKFRKELEQW